MNRKSIIFFVFIFPLLCAVCSCSDKLVKNSGDANSYSYVVDDSGVHNIIIAPKPIKETMVEPKYPIYEKKKRVVGKVTIKFIVDEKGIPKEFSFTRKLTKGLNKAALDAIKQWRFKPALKDNEPISEYFSVTFNFDLR